MTPHIEPPESDGWQAHFWLRAEIGPELSVDLVTGHNLMTDRVDAPVVLIDGIGATVEIKDRRQLDAVIAALTDASRVWDALNP
ncbi:hypothetical protein [Gordonia sp. ABSL49_1]|uniref:hypothetical protein n=1 Tax=Gordonia sp. ABSL49_1 TaxID=2920941 RepID=UPI001F102F3D|nr:hypothetical protein [Gordonia sp. ABSL49_1]MCH5644148.1 hypothetical protein [Gordonia sp. ABSL49_1]